MKWILAIIFFVALSISACQTTSNNIDNSEKVAKNVEINPQAANANMQLAIGLMQQNDFSGAKQKLLLAQQQDPNNPTIQDALGYYYDVMQDYENAEIHYQRAVDLAPTQGLVNNNYGIFLCRQRKFEQAQQHFSTAFKDQSYGNMAKAYTNSALCYLANLDEKKAQQYFEKALQLDGNQTTALLELAKLNFDANHLNAAHGYINRLIQLQPNSDIALQLKQQIQVKEGTS